MILVNIKKRNLEARWEMLASTKCASIRVTSIEV